MKGVSVFNRVLFFLSVLLSISALAAVNINTATLQELEAIKGIGQAKAKAIIEYRNKQGAFNTIEELTHVPGIKAATLEKVRSEVKVEGESDRSIKTKQMGRTKKGRHDDL